MSEAANQFPQAPLKPSRRAAARANKKALAANRRVWPVINSQIIATADTGDMDALLSTVQANLQQMNLVNVSTALHRLAKMSAGDWTRLSALQVHPVLSALVGQAREELRQGGHGGSKGAKGSATTQCQAVSNIVWSLATVQFVDRPLLEHASKVASKSLSDFKPFELSSLLWAFARLGEIQPDTLAFSSRLFRQAAESLGDRVPEYSFRCLVMMVWAFAIAKCRHEPFFHRIAAAMSTLLRTASCHEMATVAFAFGDLEVTHDKLFHDLAQKATLRLAEMRARDIVNILRCFARTGFYHQKFQEAALMTLARMEVLGSEFAALVRSCAERQPRTRHCRTMLVTLLPRCAVLADGLAPGEFLILALAVASHFRAEETEEERCAGPKDVSVEALPEAALPEEALHFFRNISHSLPVLKAAAARDSGPAAALAACMREAGVLLPACEEVRELEAAKLKEADRLADLGKLGRASASSGASARTAEGGDQIDPSLPEQGSDDTTDGESTASGTRCSSSGTDMASGVVVKNTFICVEDRNAGKADIIEGLIGKPLPPPLDIIPSEVSSEKLLAFRTDYQIFRAGNAFGAKGELANSTA